MVSTRANPAFASGRKPVGDTLLPPAAHHSRCLIPARAGTRFHEPGNTNSLQIEALSK